MSDPLPVDIRELAAAQVEVVSDLVAGLSDAGWDDATYVLKGTGRVPLDAADREFLGERAAAFPAFG